MTHLLHSIPAFKKHVVLCMNVGVLYLSEQKPHLKWKSYLLSPNKTAITIYYKKYKAKHIAKVIHVTELVNLWSKVKKWLDFSFLCYHLALLLSCLPQNSTGDFPLFYYMGHSLWDRIYVSLEFHENSQSFQGWMGCVGWAFTII